MMRLYSLEKEIGHVFKDRELLQTAVTHTSYAHEYNVESNEKLEFLGDSVLEYVTSKYIFQKYPHLKEGEMTKVRAAVVCEESLCKVAKRHNFTEYLRLGRSERMSVRNGRKAILADSLEAVIAAICIDGGIEPAEKFILQNLEAEIDEATRNVGKKDYKTVLQEILQVNGDVTIEYEITKETGPDHNKEFEAQVKCNGNVLAQGKGRTKKEAHMKAAKKALEDLKVYR